MEVKVKPKSFTYDVDVVLTGERKGRMEAAGKPTVEVATPPEFKGHPGFWSPEDLFVQSVNVCTMVTFSGIALRKGVSFRDFRCHARGRLEMVDGKFRFTEILLKPTVTVEREEEVEPVRATLHEAEAACLVANSITATVKLDEEIRIAARPE